MNNDDDEENKKKKKKRKYELVYERILRLISFSHLRFIHKYNARSLPSNINAPYM